MAKGGWGAIQSFTRTAAHELFPAPTAQMLQYAQEKGWRVDSPGEYCQRCGASAGPHAALPGGCAFCIDRPLAWRRITRLAAYREPIDAWIRAMKFARQWSWADLCGQLLADVITTPPGARVAVCPVPMHWLRRWGRGYNQSALLARAIARRRGWPFADILYRTRYTRPQTSLAPSRRRANVHRAFAIRPVDLAGWHMILVDDVTTTGATLSACARLLRRAGAETVDAAVIAVADPRGRNFDVVSS